MLRTLRTCFSFAQSFNPAKNYYAILRVEETASAERIKASFKSLAKSCHPDFNKGKEEEFKEINEAYQVLSDEAARREYDASRQTSNPNHSQDPRYSQGFGGQQSWPNQGNYRQEFHQYYRGPNGQEYSYRQSGQPGWGARDQWLYEVYRQQQEAFMNQYHQTQRDKFNRRGRSPIEDEYMRRFAEELMAREELRRMKEEMQAEREAEVRDERERLEREYAENKRRLKEMGKEVVSDLKEMAKAAWHAFLDLKGKK